MAFKQNKDIEIWVMEEGLEECRKTFTATEPIEVAKTSAMSYAELEIAPDLEIGQSVYLKQNGEFIHDFEFEVEE